MWTWGSNDELREDEGWALRRRRLVVMMVESASALPPVQQALLTAIQNMSVDIRNAADRGRFGWDRLDLDIVQGWQHQLQHLNEAREIITGEAIAVGVPPRLIEHVRQRGTNGIRWHPDQTMPTTEAVDRAQLLAGLATQVGRLQEMAAVHAAYTRRYSDVPGEPQTWFQLSMKALREHIGALAHALDLSAAERKQLWPDAASIAAATTRAHALDDEALTEQWRSRASLSNLIAESLPIDVLQGAGITSTDTAAAGQLPPAPQQLIALAETVVDATTTSTADTEPTPDTGSVRAGDGALIHTAIEQAGLNSDTHTTPLDEATDPPSHPLPLTTNHGIDP
ncbi:hypothetical protein [Nocardia sp. NPDC052112]|uniref:hypothetical protein n=1 Tax=Nocardia sp. NPDC052112 TaxID=3155646 RepID=UPI003418B964